MWHHGNSVQTDLQRDPCWTDIEMDCSGGPRLSPSRAGLIAAARLWWKTLPKLPRTCVHPKHFTIKSEHSPEHNESWILLAAQNEGHVFGIQEEAAVPIHSRCFYYRWCYCHLTFRVEEVLGHGCCNWSLLVLKKAITRETSLFQVRILLHGSTLGL